MLKDTNDTLEGILGTSSTRLDVPINNGTPKFDYGYFQEQARKILGFPSQDLASELESFQRDKEIPDFGITHLKKFLKRDHQIKNDNLEEELGKYKLGFDMASRTHEGIRFRGNDRYFDATFNFCLTYEGNLIASLGFEPADKRIFVKQIQGVKGNVNALKPFRWERALVQYAVQWAERYGIPEIEIVSVDNLKWAKWTFDYLKEAGVYPEGLTFSAAKTLDLKAQEQIMEKIKKSEFIVKDKVYLMPHQGFLLYDVTAQRNGFNRANGNYVKKLELRGN
ncbi:hypothetical protein HYX04_05690 [Candidatus Woesearchaeota archaeon]|nr:hypothetical protein [Candidatus Woesearchaeota archaeon]